MFNIIEHQEVQVKTIMIYHYIHTGMAKIKSINKPNAGEYIYNSHIAGW